MSPGLGGGPSWNVRLGREAAGTMRGAPPVVRRSLASVLDRLSAGGLPADAHRRPDGTFEVAHGDLVLVVVVRPGESSILVGRIELPARTPGRDALRAARFPARFAARVGGHLDELWSDLRTAVRGLRRAPGFVVAVVGTVAVAIAGAATLFGLGATVFTQPLPFENDSELLRLRDRQVTAGGEPRIFNMSPLDFTTIREESGTLRGVAAARGVNHVLLGDGAAQRVNVIRVSRGWADVLGVRPILGRRFSDEEERMGAGAGAALISHALWESRFGRDPGVIGRRVAYDGGAFTVVGVMGPGFRFPYEADLWMPWRWDPSDGVSHDLHVAGRMAPGRTIEDVREELGRIAAGLRASRADTNADLHLHATSLREDMIRDNGQLMVGLMAAVGFLLILACVNVTTMFVARFIARRREVGIRVALGAARGREIRGFVVETLLLFLAGGGIALILALWLGDVVSGLLPDGMRSDFGIRGLSLTPTLALFTAGVALVAGALVGIASALRGGKVNVMTALRASSRSVAGPAGRLQRGLVVTQLALSLALLVGAGVLFQHFRRLSTQELGFEIDELYTLRISLEQDRYGSPDERARVIGELTNSLSLLPGVESVGYTTVNPLCCGDWGAPLAVEGQPQPEGSTHLIHHRMVGPGYFATMGTPLLRGRDFDSRDRPGSPPSVIVDEALADRFWPGADPVGRRVRLDRPGSEWMTVVGVVGSLVEEGDYTETWYLPYTRDPTARSGENLHFMLRAEDASALQEARRAVRQVDADLAVYGLAPMASLRSENISQDRLGATVGAGFGGFGLLLAALGVFGMLSYTVSARSRELGIRIALGSHPTELTTLVLKSAGTLAAAGAGIGLALAFGLNRVLEAVVFGVDRASPALLAGLAAVLLLAALAAASLPALRASRVDPVQVLKD